MAERKHRAFPYTPADDICISGMGGRFPKAIGLYELRDKLYNKVNIVLALKRAHPEDNYPRNRSSSPTIYFINRNTIYFFVSESVAVFLQIFITSF